jgi:hypothetical protein
LVVVHRIWEDLKTHGNTFSNWIYHTASLTHLTQPQTLI